MRFNSWPLSTGPRWRKKRRPNRPTRAKRSSKPTSSTCKRSPQTSRPLRSRAHFELFSSSDSSDAEDPSSSSTKCPPEFEMMECQSEDEDKKTSVVPVRILAKKRGRTFEVDLDCSLTKRMRHTGKDEDSEISEELRQQKRRSEPNFRSRYFSTKAPAGAAPKMTQDSPQKQVTSGKRKFKTNKPTSEDEEEGSSFMPSLQTSSSTTTQREPSPVPSSPSPQGCCPFKSCWKFTIKRGSSEEVSKKSRRKPNVLAKLAGKVKSKVCPFARRDSSSSASSSGSYSSAKEQLIKDVFYETDECTMDKKALKEFSNKYTFTSENYCSRNPAFRIVSSGKRKADQLPVTYRVSTRQYVPFIWETVDGVVTKTPLEVYLLRLVGASPNSENSIVSARVLDWADLGNKIVVVLEHTRSLNLEDYLRNNHPFGMDSINAKILFRQLVEAAIEMDAKGVFHKDIRPLSVLVEGKKTPRRARYTDFNFATTFLPGQTFESPLGHPLDSCPEWFRDEPYTAEGATVWQLGTVLNFMLTRKLALIREDSIGSLRKVPISTKFDPDLRDLLQGCLEKDPKKRFTLDTIINHPWLNSDLHEQHLRQMKSNFFKI